MESLQSIVESELPQPEWKAQPEKTPKKRRSAKNPVITPSVPQNPLNAPPVTFTRDSNGLLNHINYVFDAETGFIDWRAMVPDKYLVPNRQIFERLKKPVPETIDGLNDKELLILLDGIKFLARLRGYSEVHSTLYDCTQMHAAATCHIRWFPNYETEGKEKVFGDAASATPDTTKGFGQNYLASIAQNRAFIRAVRNFLGIEIVGADEVGGNAIPEQQAVEVIAPDAQRILDQKMKEKNVSFEALKKVLIKDGIDVSAIESTKDIPSSKCFELIARLNKLEKK